MRFLGLSRSKQHLVRSLLLLIISFTIALAIYSYVGLGNVGEQGLGHVWEQGVHLGEQGEQGVHLGERSPLFAERSPPVDRGENEELEEALSKMVQESFLPRLETDIETLTEDDGKYIVVGDNLQVEKGKRENLLFLKTHKCGTSSMVNIFYLWAVRRRKNFVLQPWTRQLDITK